MIIKAFSNNKEVIASNTLLMFESSDSLILKIKADNGFSFEIHLDFKEDETDKRNLSFKVEGSSIFFECKNFEDIGAGTTSPIQIATIKDRNIYIHFWSWRPVRGVRRIQYTLYSDGGMVNEE